MKPLRQTANFLHVQVSALVKLCRNEWKTSCSRITWMFQALRKKIKLNYFATQVRNTGEQVGVLQRDSPPPRSALSKLRRVGWFDYDARLFCHRPEHRHILLQLPARTLVVSRWDTRCSFPCTGFSFYRQHKIKVCFCLMWSLRIEELLQSSIETLV